MSGLLIWGLVCFLLGLVGYLAVPILVGPSLPLQPRQKMGRLYVGQAMTAAGRALLVARKNGSDLQLEASGFDSTHGQEEVSLGGDTQRYDDPDDSMSRLAKRPFGLANEADGVITTPRDIELGEMEKKKVEDSEHMFIDESGERYYQPHTHVPAGERLVKPPTGGAIVGGSADASAIDLIIEYVKKAQAGFDEMSLKQAGAILTAYGVGAGVVWLMVTQGGGGGGGFTDAASNFGVYLGGGF